MPRRDGTGPVGKGPKTGWGQGRCRPVEVTKPERDDRADSDPAYNAGPGLSGADSGGFGSIPAGRGLGRGRGCGFGPGGGAGRGPGRGQGRGRGRV